jgi:hypothetical protein
LYPDFSARIREGKGCATLVVFGEEIAIVRGRLAARSFVMAQARRAATNRDSQA